MFKIWQRPTHMGILVYWLLERAGSKAIGMDISGDVHPPAV